MFGNTKVSCLSLGTGSISWTSAPGLLIAMDSNSALSFLSSTVPFACCDPLRNPCSTSLWSPFSTKNAEDGTVAASSPCTISPALLHRLLLRVSQASPDNLAINRTASRNNCVCSNKLTDGSSIGKSRRSLSDDHTLGQVSAVTNFHVSDDGFHVCNGRPCSCSLRSTSKASLFLWVEQQNVDLPVPRYKSCHSLSADNIVINVAEHAQAPCIKDLRCSGAC